MVQEQFIVTGRGGRSERNIPIQTNEEVSMEDRSCGRRVLITLTFRADCFPLRETGSEEEEYEFILTKMVA